MNKSIELRKLYWVIHTDQYKSGLTTHSKQVMHEVWRDGHITEEPLSGRFAIDHTEFERAVDAYDWNEVLGDPEDYIGEK